MGIQQGARLVVGWVLIVSQEYKEAEVERSQDVNQVCLLILGLEIQG